MVQENKENLNQRTQPNQTVQTPPISSASKSEKSNPVKTPIIIACFMIGIIQIIIPLILFIFVIPQLNTLYKDLNTAKPPSFYFGYLLFLLMIFIGAVNIYLGIKLIKNLSYFMRATIFVGVSFFFTGFIAAGIVLSVINPIYQIVGQIDKPENSQTISPTLTPDPTANWKTYTGSDFTFKYPPDWIVQPQIGMERRDHPEDFYLEMYDHNNVGYQPDELIINSNGNISTSSASRKFQLTNRGDDSLNLMINNTPINFSCAFYSKKQTTIDICNEILSTFKFTQSTGGSNPLPTAAQKISCQTNSDCKNGQSCEVWGPIVANGSPNKYCTAPGQAVPL